MATTTNYAFPYPSENDVPNGPIQIGSLAVAVDSRLLALMKKPLVSLVAPAAQSLPHATKTPINFGVGSELIDTHGFHSTSTNISRVTPSVPGYYRVTGSLLWQSNGVGERNVWVGKNGITQPTVDRDTNQGLGFSQSACRILAANGVTDYFTLIGWQDSGAGLQVFGTVDNSTYASVFEVEYLRPL